jgi:1-acyl-sn-glycerol-3-phosphate acyltransferase
MAEIRQRQMLVRFTIQDAGVPPRLVAADSSLSRAILAFVSASARPSWLYLAVGAVSWPVVKVIFRLRASGVENVPKRGGFVLAANHWSNFDPWPLALPLFPSRFLRFMAKAELFWFPLSRIVVAGGAFKVRRGERDEEAIRTAIELVRSGNGVVMFPEGTRRSKGLRKRHEARWRTGAARIALAADAPLVPAGISGTERLGRLGPLRVAYGAPIATEDLADLPVGDAAHVATDRLRDAIVELERGLA